MRYLILVMLFIGSLFLAGCGLPNELTIDKPAANAVETTPEEPPMVIGQTPEKMQKRFDPTIQDDGDLEQGELRWAHRYEELSVGNNALRETNHELTLENDQLKQKIKMLESELEQTQKDMTEANEFLGQMHLELNKWKKDVLGFRQEIRLTQQVQIEALGKILRVLGAEPIDTPEVPDASLYDSEELQ